ncbi:hypothetical protein B0T10DRAFT_553252 [Thelonectria olida]|uniref:Uncharacterized protein n=1 Tax=Thelonectria olida TaxID=1576542 RepID=A0A9P9AKP7_9HYPO|nr:hypothetical protein B0T10DRAFT_553252 [Thelonectria olida]
MNSTTEAKALEGSDGGTKRLGSLLYASWSSFPVILQPMSRHYSEPLSPGNDCPLNGIARDRYRGLDQHIDYVYLQSWAKSQNQKYWVIERKAMPCHRSDGKSPILSRRGVHGLHKDLVSPPGNEQNIATILKLVDIMMDRCEETAPTQPQQCRGQFLRWGRNEGSDKEAEEDYEEPGLQEEGADILNDGMTGITGEAGDDEDTDGEEASAGNEIPVPRESAAELLELLFGLSLALCTEPLTDSLPSSTVLVYFSGILDFSTSLQPSSPPDPTRHISRLIYLQRLLFLKMALPLRGYSVLVLSAAPGLHNSKASVNLAEVKDDMTNTENDFSFIKHPENNLQDAYLELCERACTARRDSLSRRGRWNWQAVFKYVEKEEALREFLGLGVLMLGVKGRGGPTCVACGARTENSQLEASTYTTSL